MILKKIISGGQTGADIAGLRAAKLGHLETGGTAPKGYRTLNGPNLELRDIYGLVEHFSASYPPRTGVNVKDSDGTIRFASNFNSPGERCTFNAIERHGKISIDVNVNNPQSPETIAKWVEDNSIATLNVAGNSEQTSPGIEAFVMDFMLKVIRILRGD